MSADRPLYVVTLRAEPGIDGLRALRAALKLLLRTFGLRCLKITTNAKPAGDDAGNHGD